MNTGIRSTAALTCLSVLLAACGSGGSSEQQELNTVAVQNEAIISTSALSESNQNTVSTEEGCQLTVLDEEVLRLVNEARASARYCGDLLYQAAPPVVASCQLKEAALSHSQDMGEHNFFSHTGSDGLRVNHRVDAINYDWVMLGENLAAGFNSAYSVVSGWLASPEHCVTIMNASYQQTATALYISETADYATYWTMIMAKPAIR